ncbi:hypothetical protein VNO77_19568 [Canavalia gladiata]|uniref:Uncharacterized protein n=1 Tax=Canavalia gladiata TaxID=3824 RepID=A0AAN9LR62_CANGL
MVPIKHSSLPSSLFGRVLVMHKRTAGSQILLGFSPIQRERGMRSQFESEIKLFLILSGFARFSTTFLLIATGKGSFTFLLDSSLSEVDSSPVLGGKNLNQVRIGKPPRSQPAILGPAVDIQRLSLLCTNLFSGLEILSLKDRFWAVMKRKLSKVPQQKVLGQNRNLETKGIQRRLISLDHRNLELSVGLRVLILRLCLVRIWDRASTDIMVVSIETVSKILIDVGA